MATKWKEKSKLEKTADIFAWILLIAWVVFEYLERKNKWDGASLAGYISLCLVCACEAVSLWKEQRKLFWVSVVGVLLMVAMIILEIL